MLVLLEKPLHVRIVFNIEDFHSLSDRPIILTFGNFDGVHLGHRHLLSQVYDQASSRSGTSVAVTFAPHPQYIVKGAEPAAITSLDEKIVRLAETGLEYCVVHPFDIQTSSTER